MFALGSWELPSPFFFLYFRAPEHYQKNKEKFMWESPSGKRRES